MHFQRLKFQISSSTRSPSSLGLSSGEHRRSLKTILKLPSCLLYITLANRICTGIETNDAILLQGYDRYSGCRCYQSRLDSNLKWLRVQCASHLCLQMEEPLLWDGIYGTHCLFSTRVRLKPCKHHKHHLAFPNYYNCYCKQGRRKYRTKGKKRKSQYTSAHTQSMLKEGLHASKARKNASPSQEDQTPRVQSCCLVTQVTGHLHNWKGPGGCREISFGQVNGFPSAYSLTDHLSALPPKEEHTGRVPQDIEK